MSLRAKNEEAESNTAFEARKFNPGDFGILEIVVK